MAGIDDRYWNSYEYWADDYLKRPEFKGTPITGKMLRDAAEEVYKKNGTIVPLQLALAQGQRETRFGTDDTGRPSYRENPFNVGEYDNSTEQTFPDTASGVRGYYDLISRRYLGNNTMEGLLKNFVNDEGQRYATDPGYESYMVNQTDYINRRAKAQWNKIQEKRSATVQKGGSNGKI